MNKFLNLIRMQAALAGNQKNFVRLGQISGYDPDNFLAKAIIYPADPNDDTGTTLETGWLPIFSPWVGNNWGMFAAPSIGDICEIQFQEANLQTGFICLRTYTYQSRPLSVQSGEFWLVHQSGSFIKLTNDGKVNINGNVEIDVSGPTINITATSVVNVQAPEINLGTGTLETLMTSTAIAVYNSHTHNDPQGGTTGVPNQQITGSQTSQVKAS